ncbi:MAG TPA: DUF5985 family protein [Sphingomicrobium sp.]|jgi:hypothetical protein|nr:DUF5985 family protein [Sphingomicrobium sp.]
MVTTFLAGAIVAGFAMAGLFFLKFWKKTRDELFLAFTGAFWLLGLGQALLTFSNIPLEERTPLYLLRLAAFVLILVAIWRKNRSPTR